MSSLFNKKKLNSNIANLCVILICIFIFLLSIGFSAFSNDLILNDITATVRLDEDIRIKSIVVKEVSEDVSISYLEYNVNNTSVGVLLPFRDSYAIFDVGIVNLGNVEMGLKSILGSSDSLNYEIVNSDYINDGYNNYSMKEKLCNDGDTENCKLGIESHILVKISYKSLADYDSLNNYFDINMFYDFKRIYQVDYSERILGVLKETPVRNVMEDEDIFIGINIINVRDVNISSSYILYKNVDYLFDNKVLNIKNVADNIYLDLSSNFDYDNEIGLIASAEFISPRDINITLDGSNLKDQFFIKVYPNDIKITKDSTVLYDKKWTTTNADVFKTGEATFIYYEYLDGNVVKGPFGNAFTIKYRDTTTKCSGINANPELVTNHSKNLFDMLGTGISKGNITKDAVEYISVYSAAGFKFDNFRFNIKYGRQSEFAGGL